jgi:GGDEF domain-containing protein
MTDVSPAPLAGRVVTGALLLAGGAAAVATVLVPSSPSARGAALAVVAASLLTSVLGTEVLRGRRVARGLVVGLALAGLGPVIAPLGHGIAVVAVPAAGAAVLLWAALALGRGAALQLAVPAVVAAGTTWVNGDPAVPTAALAVLPAALVLAEGLAWPLSRARRTRELAEAAMTDIDTLLVAGIDLRGVDDVAAAGDRICRLGTELLRGDGALLYVQGPGRLLLGGRHGSHPAPLDPELGRNAALVEALRVGAVRPGNPVLVPVTGAAGVIGVIAVSGARREIDDLTAGVAQLFGGQAGAVLDRLNAVASLFDAATRDPITGVGNRQQAAAIIASLRPGDGLLVLEVDGFESLRRAQGEAAADLLLGQVGLHLRNGTRTGDAVARYGDHQFVVVLRELKAPIDMVVGRLVESWMAGSPSRTMSVGGALQLDSTAPLDTIERAESALASAQRRGGGRGHVAPDFSVFAA